MLNQILEKFGINPSSHRIEEYGSGLINRTWKVHGEQDYILQRINTDVFQRPESIVENLLLLQKYLGDKYPDYLFVAPLPALNGSPLVTTEEGTYRLFPFIHESQSINEVTVYKQAYEAAKQFGKFARLLKDFDASRLKYTLQSFHDLNLRYEQFDKAYDQADPAKLQESEWAILQLRDHSDILVTYNHLLSSDKLPVRVVHHDAKINNVLFDEEWNGICLIDLDTVMPGYFISDVGDMMRTYLCPVNEDEADLSKIKIDEQCLDAIISGYFSEMGDELTTSEKEYFIYAGKFMIYMQAIRFLTDHLNGDIYYHIDYTGQNLVRAKNQLTLLNQLIQLEEKIDLLTNPSLKK